MHRGKEKRREFFSFSQATMREGEEKNCDREKKKNSTATSAFAQEKNSEALKAPRSLPSSLVFSGTVSLLESSSPDKERARERGAQSSVNSFLKRKEKGDHRLSNHHGAFFFSLLLSFQACSFAQRLCGNRASASGLSVRHHNPRVRGCNKQRDRAEDRELRASRRESMGAMVSLSLSRLSRPTFSPRSLQIQSRSRYNPFTALSQPLRLDIKVRANEDKKNSGDFFLFFSFDFFSMPLSFAHPPIKFLSINTFLHSRQRHNRSASPSGPIASRASTCTRPSHGKGLLM